MKRRPRSICSEKRIFDALFYAEGNRVKSRWLLKEYVKLDYDSPYRLLTAGKTIIPDGGTVRKTIRPGSSGTRTGQKLS